MLKNKFLIVLSAIILIILMIVFVKYVKNLIEINRINNLYKDIEILDDRISLYYLNNGNIPIKNQIKDFQKKYINPNDNDIYYEIDLDKLENLQLSYGNESLGFKDKYIINTQSHTIYYYKGIKYKDDIIYSRNLNYQYVDLEEYK